MGANFPRVGKIRNAKISRPSDDQFCIIPLRFRFLVSSTLLIILGVTISVGTFLQSGYPTLVYILLGTALPALMIFSACLILHGAFLERFAFKFDKQKECLLFFNGKQQVTSHSNRSSDCWLRMKLHVLSLILERSKKKQITLTQLF